MAIEQCGYLLDALMAPADHREKSPSRLKNIDLLIIAAAREARLSAMPD